MIESGKTLDEEILELEETLGYSKTQSSRIEDFDNQLFSDRYPSCINQQIKDNSTVLFNGVDFQKLTQTEIAILFARDFSGEDRWGEKREKILKTLITSNTKDKNQLEEVVPLEKDNIEKPDQAKAMNIQIEGVDNKTSKLDDLEKDNLKENAGHSMKDLAEKNQSKRQSLYPPSERPSLNNEDMSDQKPCICNNQKEFKHWDQVQCDNCEVWYHQFCVGLTRTQVLLLNRFRESLKWFCLACQTK